MSFSHIYVDCIWNLIEKKNRRQDKFISIRTHIWWTPPSVSKITAGDATCWVRRRFPRNKRTAQNRREIHLSKHLFSTFLQHFILWMTVYPYNKTVIKTLKIFILEHEGNKRTKKERKTQIRNRDSQLNVCIMLSFKGAYGTKYPRNWSINTVSNW